jgi:hypothetical protein
MNRDALTQFDWRPQPGAAAHVRGLADRVLARLPGARRLAERLLAEAGVRWIDLIDTIVLADTVRTAGDAARAGFAPAGVASGARIFRHPGGIFPRLALRHGFGDERVVIALKVESVADFLAAQGLNVPISGPPGSGARWAHIEDAPDAALAVAERHGTEALWLDEDPDLAAVARVSESFRLRRRTFPIDEAGFEHAAQLIDDAIAQVGRDRACDLFFAAEREFWQRRNRAAQFQKARQDALGIGWANHDHHTYRSSRSNFTRLVAIWESLGFVCRERFYAGREAGWGAQVMEQPVCGIVTFNDVDLSPDELLTDFAHEPLPSRDTLGTVGLWCGLHGDSFLQAGMHHLECTFDFESLKRQIESIGRISLMKPFTDFPHLRQAFTEGERWPVAEERIRRLLQARLITPEQAETFRRDGAIGSHLENLERNDGYKGFNQKGVSEIIAATDPRIQAGAAR